MRQLIYAMALMLAGALSSTLLAFLLASNWRSFSHNWLIPLVFMPAIGLAFGCWLAHRSSKEEDPWPITGRGRLLFFVLLGGAGCATASYLQYIAISSAWFHSGFLEMVFTPSLIKTFSETNKYGQHESSLAVNMIIGLLAGSYGTYRLIREKLFT